MKGVLYMVPATLGSNELRDTIPAGTVEIVLGIRVFIVENLRSARRYLKLLDRNIDIDRLTFFELNEHTPVEQVPSFLVPAEKGLNTAIISEAGMPGVADPGTVVVKMAHEKGIRVVPLTGPSSILLSLMASGLNGQHFTFHGYLPIQQSERARKIRELEQEMQKTAVTQIFIEAPYRNDKLLADLLGNCHPSTLICIAADLTLESELIHTRTVARWKKNKPSLHKRPAIFLMGK
ncbi:MAG: SAM-dependent methyltransferase [Bacteroidales bacterium]